MNRTPIELLVDLEDSRAIPEAVSGWLRGALRRYRNGLDLEAALELRGPGARRTRDLALKRAAAVLAPDAGAWSQAGALLRELRRTRSEPDPRRWPDGFRRDLQRALNAGLAVPDTQPGIYSILTKT